MPVIHPEELSTAPYDDQTEKEMEFDSTAIVPPIHAQSCGQLYHGTDWNYGEQWYQPLTSPLNVADPLVPPDARVLTDVGPIVVQYKDEDEPTQASDVLRDVQKVAALLPRARPLYVYAVGTHDVSFLRFGLRGLQDLSVRHSREEFEILAATAPARLIDLIESGELQPADLTFAAEIAGSIRSYATAVPTLLALLEHRSSLVREGAVYGLGNHLSDEVKARLRDLAAHDPSPGVRDAATEALDG